ncbi:hypothetical protein B2J93_6536 [Marssonina coronariae]|uniref:Uncharacterized protein n=1 Tax=Diplocarpon coronariae TaxID=2795749 RepID=A0A218Z001_9HELO|nr:hypothetical protein B2J93_6536 [Marssonina coronariae]
MGASKPVESSKEQVAKSTTAKATRAVAEVEAPKAPQLRAKIEVPEAAKPPVPWRDGDTKAQESLGNSRVSRHRNILKPLYNLKALSSIQGRHPKPTRRNRLELGDPDHGGITITYSFGRAQAAGPGIRRETTIAGLKCAFCLAPNRNLDELRLHLHTDHGAYKFRLRKAYPPRAAHFIELTRKHRSSPAFPAELQRTIQLGRPISLSDLDKHLSGDESWSRRSSPNTSNADDATMDESHELRPKGAIKNRKIYYAPAVARPPYDTNTKRLLRTGDELADEDVEVDEAWLHLKQKDTINDFEEAVVCPRRRDSSTLQRVFVRFVETKKTWLAKKKPARMMELTKQAHDFIMKRVLDERSLRQCADRVGAEAKELAAREDKHVDVDCIEDAPAAQRFGTCICGQFQPVKPIMCRGTVKSLLLLQSDRPVTDPCDSRAHLRFPAQASSKSPAPSIPHGLAPFLIPVPSSNLPCPNLIRVQDRLIFINILAFNILSPVTLTSTSTLRTTRSAHSITTALGMEMKQARPGTGAAAEGLEVADKQIFQLQKRVLPNDPHLLTVPTDNPYRDTASYEYRGTPFANYEVRQLQHMTMISSSRRGVARAEGDWQARIESYSPVSLAASSTATPSRAKEVKAPKQKISLGDYQKSKITGVKPSPKTLAEGHARKNSAASVDTPPGRMSSCEGAAEARTTGAPAASPTKSGRPVLKDSSRSAAPHAPETKARHATNGYLEVPAASLAKKESINTLTPQKSLQNIRPPVKHQLPPRPQSPTRQAYDARLSEPKKRPLEPVDTRPEKRTKIEQARTPLGAQNHPPRKAELPSEQRLSPTKNHKVTSTSASTPNRASPLPKGTPDAKPAPAKQVRTEKQRPLPGLLGPLPEDLTELAKPNKFESRNSTHVPPKHDSDTIVVKDARGKDSPSSTPSQASKSSSSYSPLRPLPKMLSPNLPLVVERELERLDRIKADEDLSAGAKESDASASASRDTVGARYEEVRRPNVPGVARKTVTPKVGHPPKKAPAESSRSRPPNEKERESLVVKLKYKKRIYKTLQRIVGMQPKPSKEFSRREKERIACLNNGESESEDESGSRLPPATVTAKAAPPKKRPSDTSERAEPPPKRAKLPPSIDASKTKASLEPPFKSPAPTAKAQKDTPLSTSKRADAIKSAAMRNAGSIDGSARTPQTMSTSTPASAEKTRTNGDARPPLDERLRIESDKASEAATRLKRRMDEILQTKGKSPELVPEVERKLGICIGIEAMTIYIASFVLRERYNKNRGLGNWETSLGLWNYLERVSRPFPLLHSLNVQLGAILKQETGRVYLEQLQRNAANSDYLRAMAENSAKCDQHWREVHQKRKRFEDLGIKQTLGPWSTPREATEWIMQVLHVYSGAERTGWKVSGSSR